VSDKANITLRLDSDLLREARVLAAQEGTSVSQLVAGRLEEVVRRQKTYDVARRRALARLKKGYDLDWTPSGSRDELHER
jgi:16S rRNA G527 N7-methylase RsmG